MKRDGLTLPQRLIKFARDVWMVLGIAVAMFVALEAAVSRGFYIRGFLASSCRSEARASEPFLLFSSSFPASTLPTLEEIQS